MAEKKTDEQNSEKKGFFSRMFGGIKERRAERKARKEAEKEKRKEERDREKAIVRETMLQQRTAERIAKLAEKEEKGKAENLARFLFYGIFLGAFLGAIFGVVSSVTGIFPFGLTRLSILTTVASGAAIGVIYQFFKWLLPKEAIGFVKIIGTFIIAGLILVYAWNIYTSGLAAPGETKLKALFSGVGAWFSEQSTCVINPKECYAGGWEVRTPEEEVYVRLNFPTTDLFYDGKEKPVEADIEVMNPEKAEIIQEFTLEPECYVDGKQTETEHGNLDFYKSDKVQFSSIICKIKPEDMKEKESIKVKIKLIRPVVSKVQFTLFTLSKEAKEELRKQGKAIPGEDEAKGSAVRYAGIPYEFGIGIGESQPLSEGSYSFRIKFEKKPGEGKLKKIEAISVKGQGENARIEKCEGYKKQGEWFVLEELSENQFDLLSTKGGTSFCDLVVEPSENEQKIVFTGIANYKIETEYEQGIIIVKGKA